MPSAKTQPARGMRDFLPADVRKREYVIGVIKSVYARDGFEPLETPAVENIETLVGKYGEEGNQRIFKILKRGEHEKTGEADLALRYDLTVPLARVVAQYQNELPKFFKRYQIQPVWRADRPAKGRFREFFQCDIDSMGSTSPLVEVDQLAAICDVMGKLGFADFKVRLNHRRVLTGLLNRSGIAESRHGQALIAIDKLEKIGRDRVLLDIVGYGVATSEAVALLDSMVGRADPLAFLRDVFVGDPESAAAAGNLEEIVRLSSGTAAAGNIEIDLSLARGLSYYTGAIMEIAVPDLAGSLGGGGRYDNLIGMFLGKDVPACGFSLGLERLIVVMTERNMFPATVAGSPIDILVTIWKDEARADAVTLAAELR